MLNEKITSNKTQSVKLKLIVLLVLCAFVITYMVACEQGPNNTARGFSLPVGSAENGAIVFENYRCVACHRMNKPPHTLGDKALADSEATPSPNEVPDIMYQALIEYSQLERPITLGGEVTRTKTYADLVTSIINPSHKIARQYISEQHQSNGASKMKNYNDVMTVTELIDLVTFLQPHYQMSTVLTEYTSYP